MGRTVADVMHRGVIGCQLDSPLSHVATLMRDNHISCVVVLSNDGEIRGIITQTDMVRIMREEHFERRPWNLLAEHMMTPEVMTTTPYSDLEEATKLMSERRIHRLVVVDPAQPTKPIGICSLTDLVRVVADEEGGKQS